MRTEWLYASILSSVVAATPSLRAEEENTPESRARLVEMKKYAEAFQAFKAALDKEPESAPLLYNTGLMAYLSDNPKESIDPWVRLRKVQPDAWIVRTKLIQAYEAVGDVKKRDAERADLFKARSSTDDPGFKQSRFYCRDQFGAGKTRVMVFEYFELEGERAVRYSFRPLGDDGVATDRWWSLGSYESTNQIARELGTIKAGGRVFHLDGYTDGGSGHATYGMFTEEPSYEAVKAKVKKIISDEESMVGPPRPKGADEKKPEKGGK